MNKLLLIIFLICICPFVSACNSQTATEPKDPRRNITVLLKDLTPNDWKEFQGSKIPPPELRMVSSDLMALNKGVQKCWNVEQLPKGITIQLRVLVNPDRTVKEVIVMDQARYAKDEKFRAAADAARKAILDPKCSTLDLPPEKYETWKSFIYVFETMQML